MSGRQKGSIEEGQGNLRGPLLNLREEKGQTVKEATTWTKALVVPPWRRDDRSRPPNPWNAWKSSRQVAQERLNTKVSRTQTEKVYMPTKKDEKEKEEGGEEEEEAKHKWERKRNNDRRSTRGKGRKVKKKDHGLYQVGSERMEEDCRTLSFRVDSGACTTCIPKTLKAARGYKVHFDDSTGRSYHTASNHTLKDGGWSMVQSVALDDGLPLQVKTRRVAGLRSPLLSVKSIVEKGGTVTFSPSGSRVSLKTNKGERHIPLTMDKGGWRLDLELQAPDTANRVWAELAAMAVTEKASGRVFHRQGSNP